MIPCRSQGASSIPTYHTLFPATLLHQQFFHPPSLHPAVNFLVSLLALLFPNSCTILFWNPIFFHSMYMPKRTLSMQPYCLCTTCSRFLIFAYIPSLLNIVQFSFPLLCTGPKILQYTFLSKGFSNVTYA